MGKVGGGKEITLYGTVDDGFAVEIGGFVADADAAEGAHSVCSSNTSTRIISSAANIESPGSELDIKVAIPRCTFFIRPPV